MNNKVFMTVEERWKDIPYKPETHSDSQNYGFKNLKGNPEKVEKVQEAIGFPGLLSALKAINADGSPFFSIGCEKHIGPERFGGYYAKGYIEFAFNYTKLINFQQAANLFYSFSKFYDHHKISEGATYNFDLQPAHFRKVKTDGFSCCVWTRTGGHSSHAEAEFAYNDTVLLLGKFVDQIGRPADDLERIY